jgi:hypothetical protein
MTIAMILLHRWLPARHRYSLPPREITMHLAKRAGVNRKLCPEARAALTLINHFGSEKKSVFSALLASSTLPQRDRQ